ncbi:hypothetical protein TWF103_010903 [Orbilia oligospora]|nr:hypothetical protein TWF103_010903 [Orbilia oligospora]
MPILRHASQGRLGAAGRRDVCGPLVFRGLNTRFVSFIYRSYPRRQNLSSNSNSNSSCDSRTPNLYAVPLVLQTGRIMSTRLSGPNGGAEAILYLLRSFMREREAL